jgi:hypothetical protein
MAGPTIFTGYLSDNIKVTVDNATAAGTSAIDSTSIDMTGFDGVLFIVKLGTAAANNTAKAQEDTVTGFGTVQDLAGSLTAAGVTNKVLMIDIERPTKQWVRVEVARGTSTTIDSILAIQYKARSLPITQLLTTIKQLHEPAEGTA